MIVQLKKQILMVVLSALAFCVQAQNVAIGQFRDHLSCTKGIAVNTYGSKVVCATAPGLFSFDTEDKSLKRMNKVEGFSDLGVSALAYAAAYDLEILCYSNGNIDLLKGEQIINIPDIKRSSMMGNKIINHICVEGSLAYLSCGFGIVVLDLEKLEIKDTYKIGNNGSFVLVNEIQVYHGKIYAATKQGMYVASAANANLAAFQSWSIVSALPLGNYNTLATMNDVLYTNFDKANASNQDTVFAFNNSVWTKAALGAYYLNDDIKDINAGDASLLIALPHKAWIVGADFALNTTCTVLNVAGFPDWATPARPMEIVELKGEYWMADSLFGLIHFKSSGVSEQLIPNGPAYADVWELKARNGRLWVATGGYSSSIGQTWSNVGFYNFDGNTWTNYNDVVTPGYVVNRDLVTVAPHPTEANRAYYGSFGYGIVEMSKGVMVHGYTSANSSLKDFAGGATLVTGLDYDSQNNLWALNTGLGGQALETPLHILKDGQWTGFKIPAVTSNATILIKLMIDSQGNKWMIKTKSNFGVVVTKEKDQNYNANTVFTARHLSIVAGSGKLPSEKVNDIVEDKKGKIWFATDQGVAVTDVVSNATVSGLSDVQQILIEENGVWHHLLESQRVTSIAVDGGNKKWLGTEGAGVFQLSEDGTKQLQHFTAENSVLISNNIVDIAIDDVTGEVFFGTDRGIVSYRGTATGGAVSNDVIYAFPNPVPHNFNGTIGIRGLVNNAIVKITDLTGVLVYETLAEGGQATWDGKRNGERVQSGVYLVFISNDDGTETAVTKIAFIH